MKNTIYLLLLCLLVSLNTRAQQTDSTKVVVIETTDGNEFIGTIVSETSDAVRINTRNFGEITISKINIKSMKPVAGQIKEGVLWFDNPQSTRYFFAPNGYGLKKGEGYYQNAWIFFNQFSVGITNNFSVGAGFVPLFLFGGTSSPFWLTPKVSIPLSKDRVNLGVGALLGTVVGEEKSNFGQAYGILTLGSRDKNLSVGLGYGYAGGELASTPTITISGMVRTGQRGYFLTENYLIDTGDEVVTLISMGGRRIIKRSGIDFGLILPFASGQDTFIAIPWLGVTVPLGK